MKKIDWKYLQFFSVMLFVYVFIHNGLSEPDLFHKLMYIMIFIMPFIGLTLVAFNMDLYTKLFFDSEAWIYKASILFYLFFIVLNCVDYCFPFVNPESIFFAIIAWIMLLVIIIGWSALSGFIQIIVKMGKEAG